MKVLFQTKMLTTTASNKTGIMPMVKENTFGHDLIIEVSLIDLLDDNLTIIFSYLYFIGIQVGDLHL